MVASILIVEDERIVALDIQTRLESLGFRVVGIARDGDTALALAQSESPDLALMDIQIVGELDGIMVAERIRERFGIPSIFLTAFSDRQNLARAKEAQAYGYLLKPFQERELVISIEMALFKHYAEQNLRIQRAILDATMNTIDDGVLTTSSNETVILINAAAEKLLGWKREDALGESLPDVLVVQETPDILDEMPGRVVRLRRKNGTSFPAQLSRIPVEDCGLSGGAWVIVFRDVTKPLEYQQKLIASRDAAESAARAKSEFMARMSHEFRTPLNAILGMTRLMRDSPDDPSFQEYLRITHSSAETMIRLVTDILDFSTYEAGFGRLLQDPFSLTELVQSTVQAHAPEAMARGIRLALVEAAPIPGEVQGDPQRIRQILNNLLSNAIKFTPSGEVIVSLSVSRGSSDDIPAGQARVELQVEDTGVGIPDEHRESAFEAFLQLEDSRTRTAGGTGLGLAIARRFAHAMGGDITLQSRENGGTRACCSLTLPTCLEDDPELMPDFSGITVAVSDHLISRVITPWITRYGGAVVAREEDLPPGGVLLLGFDEYRTCASGRVSGEGAGEGDDPADRGDSGKWGGVAERVIVIGPARERRSLSGHGDSLCYVAEPVTARSIISVLSRGCEDSSWADPNPGGSGKNQEELPEAPPVPEPFKRLLDLLDQEKVSEAAAYAKRQRHALEGKSTPGLGNSEVFFRVYLLLRRGNIRGARSVITEAIHGIG
ncbi:PAS domain S-box-containing protein [Alkalispirochaeta americana]|uniref:histidine kinase n=1 Tax=Alkalispirochaeta americana TaxID=159291 RepID=A0A1N6QZ11_9SPIO|nr:ATP-binding protein [Alkalispirochaeta americana]SIQ21825.1 PAS domain S-box-containing protein [Alkalispirochaeta americana]